MAINVESFPLLNRVREQAEMCASYAAALGFHGRYDAARHYAGLADEMWSKWTDAMAALADRAQPMERA